MHDFGFLISSYTSPTEGRWKLENGQKEGGGGTEANALREM